MPGGDPGRRGFFVSAHVLKPAGRFISGATWVATAAMTLALLPTTDAFAAGTVSGASPSVVGNTVPSQQISFITTTAFNAQVPPNVQLTDAAANTVRSTVTADGVTPDAGGGSKVTATFHFVSGFGSAPAAPGSYNID